MKWEIPTQSLRHRHKATIPGWWKAAALCLVVFWLGMGLYGAAHTLGHDCAPLCNLCILVTGTLHAVEAPVPTAAVLPAVSLAPPSSVPALPELVQFLSGANLVRGPPSCC